ncbi:MAG: hypothetical protein MUD01_18205 [Chloroflexaceae bacterium]|nr:hypothetical protein [Chloroflexaceae bacterium]
MTNEQPSSLADRLMLELGQMILADEEYTSRDWRAIAVVIQLYNRTSMFGYMWDAEGEWQGAAPDNFDIFDTAEELRAAMRDEQGNTWRCCLVQITRPGLKVKITFDWDNGNAWNVTPANLETMVATLRPYQP